MWSQALGETYNHSRQRSYHIFRKPKRIRLVLCLELGQVHGNGQIQVSVHNQEQPSKNMKLLKNGVEHPPTPSNQAFTERNVELTPGSLPTPRVLGPMYSYPSTNPLSKQITNKRKKTTLCIKIPHFSEIAKIFQNSIDTYFFPSPP